MIEILPLGVFAEIVIPSVSTYSVDGSRACLFAQETRSSRKGNTRESFIGGTRYNSAKRVNQGREEPYQESWPGHLLKGAYARNGEKNQAQDQKQNAKSERNRRIVDGPKRPAVVLPVVRNSGQPIHGMLWILSRRLGDEPTDEQKPQRDDREGDKQL